jgi:tRNA A-37 threonylcarbamoyl transferase component Bud32
MFMNDEFLPNAVLMEYIPGMQMLFLDNFTKERMAKFTEGIKLIHEARILHYDPNPRNMMVIPGDPDRILWIDFDRAQTFDDKTDLTPWQQKMILMEEEVVIAFGVAIVCMLSRKNFISG